MDIISQALWSIKQLFQLVILKMEENQPYKDRKIQKYFENYKKEYESIVLELLLSKEIEESLSKISSTYFGSSSFNTSFMKLSLALENCKENLPSVNIIQASDIEHDF